MPYVVNSEKATFERVAFGNIGDVSEELMNILQLIEPKTGKGQEELSWLCSAIDKEYNAGVRGDIYNLPSILAIKAVEYNDAALLVCASDLARVLNLPMFEIGKLIEHQRHLK